MKAKLMSIALAAMLFASTSCDQNFPHGGHPSILSNAEEFAVIARDFIMENVRLN